jgi:hypothetical protein
MKFAAPKLRICANRVIKIKKCWRNFVNPLIYHLKGLYQKLFSRECPFIYLAEGEISNLHIKQIDTYHLKVQFFTWKTKNAIF